MPLMLQIEYVEKNQFQKCLVSSLDHLFYNMVMWVVEFSREGYKIR